MPLRPLQHLEDKLQPAVRRVDLPLAQPQVQDVARLPRRRHDRMIHAPVIVAVPRAARLFPVDLDRQAVDVDDQRLRTPPPAHRLQPPPRQPLQPLAQHLDALLRRPRSHPPRQRRLRGQAPALAQRSRARPVAGGQPQRRIVAQLRGVAVVPAALPRQQKKRPRQPPLRMPDPAPVPLVRQPLRQKPHHPAAPQQLAPRQSPRIPRNPVPAGPDPDRPVEAERRIHYLHPRRDGWRVLAILLTH